MKFLIDAQLPPALCGWLRQKGHEAVHVFEIAMVDATDQAIATYAAANDFTLISKDEDFIVLRIPDRFGFLWLRCGNSTNKALIDWLAPRWEQVTKLLEKNERFIELR